MTSKVSLVATAVAVSLGAATAHAAPRSYLVMANGNNLPANLEAQISSAGGKVIRGLPSVGIAVVESESPGFAASARRISGISSVMPDVSVNWLPPADYNVEFSPEFGYPPFSGDNDTRFDLQWGHAAVDAVGAWNLGFRGAGATVAVLDGGFDLDHVDLAPNIIDAVSFISGEGPSYALPDPFSHGSHTAGTIAAADNGIGTIGVAPDAKLVLVKVLRDTGSGPFSAMIEGLIYAANHPAGVDVINMSLGAALPKNGWLDDNGTPDDPSDDYKVGANEVAGLLTAIGRATTYAYQRGVTVIASAGNEGNNGDKDKALVHTPSDAPHVISISATAPIGWATDPANAYLDYLASYSNYGKSVISFAAPGGDAVYPGNENCLIGGLVRPCWVFDLVFSTGSNLNPAAASYYWSAGTSMAAPHAAGVAAIIVGKNGGSMHPSQVQSVMRASADDLGKPGNDAAYGAGRVNAKKAVQ
jgi:subtilisin family serine protease